MKRSLNSYFVDQKNRTRICAGCHNRVTRITPVIISAPEILRIQLNLSPYGYSKKMNAFRIDQTLNLLEYCVYDQTGLAPLRMGDGRPLEYTISSVVSHAGSVKTFPKGGQYMAAVRGRNVIYDIIDEKLVFRGREKESRNPGLVENPKLQSGKVHQAYILTYIRKH